MTPLSLITVSLGVALVPFIVGATTCYIKVSIVLGLVRSALGTQNVPGPLVVAALSLSLTAIVMGAPLKEVATSLIRNQKTFSHASVTDVPKLLEGVAPLQRFLFHHTGAAEREQFHQLALERGNDVSPDSYIVVIPAFMVSELKSAFFMGFLLLVPFLVIDIVVANILVGLGMFMVNPLTITLPLKLLLFVTTDAWLLLTRGLILSYGSSV